MARAGQTNSDQEKNFTFTAILFYPAKMDANKKTLLSICASVLLSASQPAFSVDNDPGAVLPLIKGNIPQNVALNSIEVKAISQQIKIIYNLENNSNNIRTTNFSIYLPTLEWEGTGSAYDDKAFSELEVHSNNKKQKLKHLALALHNGREISSQLIKNGIDPKIILDRNAAVFINKNQFKKFKPLIDAGVLTADDDIFRPNWHVLYTHSWEQTFAPRAITRLQLSYNARPGFSVTPTTDTSLSRKISDYCGDQNIALMNRIKAANSIRLTEYKIAVGLASLPSQPIKLSIEGSSQIDAGLNSINLMCDNEGHLLEGEPRIGPTFIHTTEKYISFLNITF